MIYFPDKLILGNIHPKHVYCDRNSQEKSTGIVKEKFKLAGHQLPWQDVGRIFWILTSQRGTYPRQTTVEISEEHWEDRDPKALKQSKGFVSIDHFEFHSDIEVIAKVRDRNNGFRYSAKLCDQKFQELGNLRSRMKLNAKNSVHQMRMIAASTVETNQANEILKKMGLE